MSSDSDDIDGSENETESMKIIVSSVKKHACPYPDCHFAFDRPWKLDRHLNTHTNQRPFKCDHPECTKAYTNNSHLQRHKSISHCKNKPPPEQIPCSYPDCSKVFANKWGMKRHYISHFTVGPYKCVVCGEGFKKYWELKYHIYAHWGLDPFVCETCKESFKTRKELKRHERTHRVYNCDHEGCNANFGSWNALRTHSKAAHPAKYQCDFCKNFHRNKWTLAEHVLSHLPFDERDIILCPYQDCGRYYFYERNLGAHIRSIHYDLNYECSINGCEKTFTTRRRLKEHEKKHFQTKMDENEINGKIEESTKNMNHMINEKCSNEINNSNNVENTENIKTSKNSKNKTSKLSRAPRKDKGLPKKSMATILSGIKLPYKVSKNIAQKRTTKEDEKYINHIKASLCKESD